MRALQESAGGNKALRGAGGVGGPWGMIKVLATTLL